MTDVIVVGAGGAGLNAAIAAAEQGANVVVFDAARTVGGTAQRAGGGTCIAGSPRQRELGIEDSVDAALEDWLAFGGPDVDEGWAQRYLEASVGELYTQLAQLGVTWGKVTWNEGNRVPRWHAPIGGGRAVMAALEDRARSFATIRFALGRRVTDLIVVGGAVAGVRTDGPDGLVDHHAPSVLIATGGFANDAGMIASHVADASRASRILLGGGPGARGFGHALLARVDAAFINLDVVWMYPYGTPDPRAADGDRGLAVRGLDEDLWVNRSGERFHDESLRGGATGTPALLAQGSATAWSIIDARVASQISVADPAYREGSTPIRSAIEGLLTGSPYIHAARDLRTLGQLTGIDGPSLDATVAQHNGQRRSGMTHDPDHGRPLAGLSPLDDPPYYAIQLFPLARKNLGGVRTDANCRVLDADERPIDGLFAAGEVAGMAGGHINGRAALEGTMFGPSLFSGTVAGRAMVA